MGIFFRPRVFATRQNLEECPMSALPPRAPCLVFVEQNCIPVTNSQYPFIEFETDLNNGIKAVTTDAFFYGFMRLIVGGPMWWFKGG